MSLFTDKKPARLLLEDGTLFEGYSIGIEGICFGEIVFNTSMTGYQEILTDPSYAKQIITFSYPHIGNVGINTADNESKKIWAAGMVVHDCCPYPSNYRSEFTLEAFLIEQKIVGISGVNTRKLVAHIRDYGSQKACITSEMAILNRSGWIKDQFKELMNTDLTRYVSTKHVYKWYDGTWTPKLYAKNDKSKNKKHHVVVYDYGVKQSILRMLVDRKCLVTVVPSDMPSQSVLLLKPDGIVLSNGPGDPRTCINAIRTIKEFLCADIPLFGICLGYQLLALAGGAKIFKMKFGHHGANHPILCLKDKKVYISSQNHGFAVETKALPSDMVPTFISLFDGTLQGLEYINKPIFGMQCHPEAGPGPNDLEFLFDEFIEKMNLQEKLCQKDKISIVF